MRKTVLVSLGLLVASLLVVEVAFISCKSNNEKIEDAKEEVVDKQEDQLEAEQEANAVDNDTTSEYAKLKAETKVIIAKNETRIAEFKVKLKQETAENKKKWQVQIDKLEAKNNELKEDLDAFTATTKDKWDLFKAKVKKNADDIDKDIEDYKKEHNY